MESGLKWGGGEQEEEAEGPAEVAVELLRGGIEEIDEASMEEDYSIWCKLSRETSSCPFKIEKIREILELI